MNMIRNIFNPASKADMAEVEISGSIPEETIRISLPFVKIKNKTSILEFDHIFNYLADSSISNVLLKIKPLKIGLARANLLRKKILKLSNNGIRTHAYLENPGNIEYFIATAANQIYIPKWSTLNLVGLSSDTFYFRKFLDKTLIEPEFISKGDYKSASEMFMRSDISRYNKEMINNILDRSFTGIVGKISESRGIDYDMLRNYFDSGPYVSSEALNNKLVDRICYYEEIKSIIENDINRKLISIDNNKLLKHLKLSKFFHNIYNKLRRKSLTIAVINVNGMITEGESKGGTGGFKTSGADSVLESLKKAENDKSVFGIILRVLSPGGSALASDIIRNEIDRIRKKTPVVVSMSDVAASGGYMLSLSAEKIFADEFTLTGSIGVISGKFNISNLLKFLEIGHYNISTSKNSSIYSPLKKMTKVEKELITGLIEDMYTNFVKLVSDSRNIKPEKADLVAGGRVWTGLDAYDHNLIDQNGDISDALDFLISKVGENEKNKVIIKDIPLKVDILSSNFNKTPGSGMWGIKEILELFNKEKVLALMPFKFIIK